MTDHQKCDVTIGRVLRELDNGRQKCKEKGIELSWRVRMSMSPPVFKHNKEGGWIALEGKHLR